MNCKNPSSLKFTFLRQDHCHRQTLIILPCYRLHRFMLQLLSSLLVEPEINCSVHSAKAHTTLLCMCDVIKDPKQRSDVVCQEKLCFNCLGHHKVSYYNSKYGCHNYRRKHYTNLCSYEPQPAGQHAKSPIGHSSQPTHVGQHHTGAVSFHQLIIHSCRSVISH